MSIQKATGTSQRRRDARREETRLLLLQAAGRLFAQRGYDGVSLDAVADEAGFTKGAVYAHFSSKQDLLGKLLEWHAEQHLDEIRAMLAEPGPLAERIGQLIAPTRSTGDVETWCLLFVELWVQAMREPALRPRLTRLYEDTRAAVAEMIRRETGTLDRMLSEPAEDLGRAMLALGDGLTMQHVLAPSQRTATVYRLALHALLQSATRSPGPGP